MIHVPYKGSGQAVIDRMGGHVDANFDGLGVVLPYIRAGKLRALGVGTLQRVPQMPELPTIHEQGLSGYQSGSWFGLFAPAGTPREVIDRWSSAIRNLLAQTEFTERIIALGGQAAKPNTPEEFAAYVEREIEHWERSCAQRTYAWSRAASSLSEIDDDIRQTRPRRGAFVDWTSPTAIRQFVMFGRLVLLPPRQ